MNGGHCGITITPTEVAEEMGAAGFSKGLWWRCVHAPVIGGTPGKRNRRARPGEHGDACSQAMYVW